MEYSVFKERFERSLPVGAIIQNPGGGSSEVVSYNNDAVAYRRGKSTMRASLRVFFEAYVKHSGGSVSSRELKSYLPEVFDSEARPAGHSCNCTFLFAALQLMGLAGELSGRGVSGSPYSVVLVVE